MPSKDMTANMDDLFVDMYTETAVTNTDNSEINLEKFPHIKNKEKDETPPVINTSIDRECYTLNERLKLPDKYIRDERGLSIRDESSDTEYTFLSTEIRISKILRYIDTDIVKYESEFCHFNELRTLVLDDITTPKKLKELYRYGVDIASNDDCKILSQFLRDYVKVNFDNIPLIKIYSRTGWYDNVFISPYTDGSFILEGNYQKEAYSAKGDRSKWLSCLEKLMHYDVGIIAFGAALSTPLLDIFNIINITVQLVGRSGGGKSGTLKFAASTFANPNSYVKSFNSTQNAINAMALDSNYFPLIIDEFQVANPREMRNLPYIIQQGQSKSRSDARGRAQKVEYFRTIAITNGESSIVSDNNQMGAKRRCIKLKYSLPDELAKELHNVADNNYALFGRDWIDLIQAERKVFEDNFNDFYNNIEVQEAYRNKFPDHFKHFVAYATSFMMFQIYFCNKNENETHQDALAFLLRISNYLPNQSDSTNVSVILDAVRDYIEDNQEYTINEREDTTINAKQAKVFCKTYNGKDCIGIRRPDIKNLILRKGYDPTEILAALREDKFIIVKESPQQVNRPNSYYSHKDNTIVVNFNGSSIRVILFDKSKLDN